MPPILTVQDLDSERPLGRLSHGDRGIDETIGYMWAVVDEALRHRAVHDVARSLSTPAGVYGYLLERVRFERDPRGVERLQSPLRMIESIRRVGEAVGDCDDSAMLFAALTQAQGHVPVFVVVALPSKTKPERFGHVFAGVLRDPSRPLSRENVIPADAQEGLPFGVWPVPCRIRAGRCVARTRIYARGAGATLGGVQW